MALPGPRQVVRIGRDALRTQVCPLPTIAVVLAVVVGVLLPQLDKVVGDDIPFGVKAYLFGGGAEAARSVLNAIASSQNTVTADATGRRLAAARASSGFLASVDDERLLEAAIANDVVVRLDQQPGASLVRGAPMGAFWPCDGADGATSTTRSSPG